MTAPAAPPRAGGAPSTPRWGVPRQAGAAPAGGARERRRDLYLLLALCLLTLIAYLPSLGNGFVEYDDRQYVTENPMVQAGLTAAGWRWAATAAVAANWHPLTLLSHMLDCQLFGLNPRGHHLTSLVLHLASVLLLFAVLRRMSGAPLRSAAVAALFAVHPTHVESVAWVAERKDVLCGLFWMATLAAYVRYVRRPGPGRYGVVALALALSLAAKPMAVTLPLVLLLLDLWPLARWRGELAPHPAAGGRSALAALWPLAKEKLPLLALSAAAGAVALHTQAAPLTSSATAPLTLRLGNALTSYVAYLGKTLYPAHLAIFYPFPAEVPAWKALAAAALLLALTLGAAAAVRRAPYLLVGWLWYLITLLPVIGILQVGMQSMADRYTYLPSIGLYLAAVWGLADLARRLPRSRPRSRPPSRLPAPAMSRAMAAALLAGSAFAVLTWMTRVQSGYWSDFMTLFEHSLAVEESYLAHTNLAEGLRARATAPRALPQAGAARLRAMALAHYEAALALEPRNPQAHAAVGNALRAWGRPAEALPFLRTALALDPGDEPARITVAMALDDLGQAAGAIAELRRVVAANPASARAQLGLGALLERRGDLAGALDRYQSSLAADPGQLALRFQVAALLDRLGRPGEAAEQRRLARALAPR